MFNPNESQALLRQDFMSFIEMAFNELTPGTQFVFARYLELIAAKLEACRRGEIKRLIINVPPRHLKSHIASICFPAWILGHDPSASIIGVSYGQELADKLARDTRTLMQSARYQQLFPARLNRHAVNDFETTQHGLRMATSVGGVLTGRGADIILIDDPLKPEDALSAPQRQRVNNWYDSTLVSRLNNKNTGAIVIIMQRLHEDDLVGHVLRQESWEVISLPALAEHEEEFMIKDALGQRSFKRMPGDLLSKERESEETLKQIRKRTSDYNFSSQYQQAPLPLEGGIIKKAWLKTYTPLDLPKTFSSVLLSCDTANKAAEVNDFSVITVWGVKDGKYYLLDVIRKRVEFPALRRLVVDAAKNYRHPTILIEDKASGTQLIQELKQEGIFNIKPYEPQPRTDKTIRLITQTSVFENGQVFLPEWALWLPEYVRELTGFPGTRFDDQVDSTTQALDFLRGPGYVLSQWERLAK